MAEIINLRLARKRKARSDKKVTAENNRKKHGISSHIRNSIKAQKIKNDQIIDGHFLDKNDADKE